MQETLQEAYM